MHPLLRAVLADHLQGVTAALAAGASPDLRDAEGIPLLHHAVERRNERVIGRLLDAGAQLNTRDEVGRTALLVAVDEGDLAAVQRLLDAGADPNLPWEDAAGEQETPLTRACQIDWAEPMVALLLEAGADPNRGRADGWTPLMLCAYSGAATTVELLLSLGADPMVTKGRGAERIRAVDIALRLGHDEIVEMLELAEPDDAEVLARVRVAQYWRRLDGWYCENAPAVSDVLSLAGPAPDLHILALEHGLKSGRLPAGLRGHLSLHGGHCGALVHYWELLDIRSIQRTWQRIDETARAAGGVPRPSPHSSGAVRPVWWHRGWVPFAKDSTGQVLLVDLAPGPSGKRGQVLRWSEDRGPVGPIAPSFEAWMRRYTEIIEAGRLDFGWAAGLLLES